MATPATMARRCSRSGNSCVEASLVNEVIGSGVEKGCSEARNVAYDIWVHTDKSDHDT